MSVYIHTRQLLQQQLLLLMAFTFGIGDAATDVDV